MIKIGVCKIFMLGEPCLILGICREFVEGDKFCYKLQKYTGENYYGSTDPGLQAFAEKNKAYQGDSLHFESIGKSLTILKKVHDFDLSETEQVEITLEQLKPFMDEISRMDWYEFDLETWGK